MGLHVVEVGGPLDIVKGAAKGVAKGARKVASGAGSAAKGVGKGFAKFGKGFVRDVAPGDRGWVTRLGQMTTQSVTIVCALPKYRKSKACRFVGRITWDVAKHALETAGGMPPGTLDQVERELNKVGKDRKARERKARQIAAERKIPVELLMPAVVKPEQPSWWQELLRAIGLG